MQDLPLFGHEQFGVAERAPGQKGSSRNASAPAGRDVDPKALVECWGELDGQARFVISRSRSLVWCCSRALSLLTKEAGLRLNQGLLEPTDVSAFSQFAELAALQTGTRTLCLPLGKGEGHLLLRATLMPASNGSALVGVACHSTAHAAVPEWANLIDIFHLTSAEDRVVRMLMSGKTADVIAAENGLSIYTVRTHINHIYEKLGVSCREALWNRLAPYRVA